MDLIKSIKQKVTIYWKFVSILGVFTIFSYIIYTYLVTEINTNLYLKEIANIEELCRTNIHPDFKYVKVINYERSLKRARIFCIYDDSTKNLELNLQLRPAGWKPYLSTLLNKERNFYFPIYV